MCCVLCVFCVCFVCVLCVLSVVVCCVLCVVCARALVSSPHVRMHNALPMLAGFLAIFLNKQARGKNHFTTWHGLFGAIVTTLVVGQVRCVACGVCGVPCAVCACALGGVVAADLCMVCCARLHRLLVLPSCSRPS